MKLESALHRHTLPGPALNRAAIAGLHAALDTAESNLESRLFVIEGSDGVFCTGMDFAEATATHLDTAADARAPVEQLYALFERFTASPCIVLAIVDGRVTAGGMGLVAAADVAIATPRSSFQLSEILFGLLPATVAPFLIRRIGFQDAYRLSLTAERIDAARAASCRLVDEVTETPADSLRRLLIRVSRTAPGDIAAMKALFRRMWIMDDTTRHTAIDAITARITAPTVMGGIRGFVQDGGPPWRKPSA